MLKTSGIYAITDCDNLTENNLIEKTELILRTGVAVLQYRDKQSNQQQKKKLALKLKTLCHQYNTPFIVNDDIRLTKEIAADGVHLGKDDGDIDIARKELGSKIIGISCYNDIERAVAAEKSGADYIAFGAFFPSPTKPHAKKANIELLQLAKCQIDTPIVAIGGITPENAKPLIEAKVDYLAVISGLYSAVDTINATQSYNNLFK